jgi:chaperonin GroES
MQFAARAYPSLVPSNGNVVQCKVVGQDLDGQKFARANRVSKYMTYQIMEEMEEWEDDMDRLLVILPIVGLCYKKTYFCPIKKRNISKLVLPEDLVVNYWSTDVDDAERLTEILWKSKREVEEHIRNGLYIDADLPDPEVDESSRDHNVIGGAKIPTEQDSTTPYCILEQHGYWDLDGDGYAEPYCFTVERSSEKVLRITPSYTPEHIQLNDEGEISSIKPIKYYTKYSCIPNPDGSGYSIGFGRLLGSINDSVDTLINQLIDSGTLNNLQGGFIGKGLRIKMAETRFQPGEWKAVNSTADDMRKQILPLPTKDPSPVLFQLLGMLVQSGKELASVAEIFVGKMPGQNTPAYTTKETVEQGMKLFTAIYKRVYRSMKKEFQKLYALNKIYVDPQAVVDVLDEPMSAQDFAGPENDIIPAADPMASSKNEKATQAQGVLQMIALGTINPMEATKRALEAMEIPDLERLMMQPQPKADPEQQKMQAEMQMKQVESQQKMEIEQLKAKLKAQEQMLKMQFEKQSNDIKLQFEAMKMQLDMKKQQQQVFMDAQKAQNQMQLSDAQHTQKMQQTEQQMKMQKEQAKQQPKAKAEKKSATK